ncbi:hypothetical protein TMUPMC115_0795 [Tetragenococcus muriaticus PMC-11-5]|uniref:Uncharacterized protein n=1 Tax=Tetragenococcus muriaticus PMC-11-5 TaxID=1302649 RepID=A0A091C493_9ENTE|nr:hypothetical protein TMUPMC115_0795 [Tetragenococcus muriaticus PMC-11-5]
MKLLKNFFDYFLPKGNIGHSEIFQSLLKNFFLKKFKMIGLY